MEKLLTDFVTVSVGMSFNVELTAKNGELEIATTNDCYTGFTDGIALSLNKEKVTQLRDFLNDWLENSKFSVPQSLDNE